MSYVKTVKTHCGAGFLLLALLVFAAACAKTTTNLPKDIQGISVGMSREDAERRLREIGKFSRDEVKQQQVWSLRDDAHFGYVAIGYDKENRVRYISAIAKINDVKPMRFAEVGDVSAAKAETVEPNHRYIWEVSTENGNAPYSVIAQGNNADSLSMLTLVTSTGKGEDEEDEDREKEERK